MDMGINTFSPSCKHGAAVRAPRTSVARGQILALTLALTLALSSTLMMAASAQDRKNPPAGPPAQASESMDVFGKIGRWLDDAFSAIGGNFNNARTQIDNFNREAGMAAKSTADAAKDAANAVARLPNTRILKGHQNCPLAGNGAPDCAAAATAMCKAKGFGSGNSIDTTSAVECPTEVTLGRRAAKPGECRTVTFITRAVCL
jgi:hypothetical protein